MTAVVALATIAMNRMAGGLERNIAYLANDLARSGHRVVLLSFDDEEAEAFYELDPGVVWHKLNGRPHAPIGFVDRLKLIWRIRKALVSEGVQDLICFHHGILIRYLLARLGLKVRIVCSERNSLRLYDYTSTRKLNPNFLALALVDRVTVQFERYAADYPGVVRRKIAVVPNPVWPAIGGVRPRQPVVLSVGRHESQKRFGMLIRAFAQAAASRPEWRLRLIGEGSFLEQHKALANELGIAAKVEFLAPTRNVQSHMAECELYCQPSEWEGFPNALAEAMANGAVPVGFASTPGVSDLIRNGIDGYLADGPPTVEGLSAALAQAMDSPGQRQAFSIAAKNLAERYSVDNWRQAWRAALAA